MAENTPRKGIFRRGDGGSELSSELGYFFEEIGTLTDDNGDPLGFTITSTTRNEKTHPNLFKDPKKAEKRKTSQHYTGHAFDVGIKSNVDLSFLKYLFGNDFDPNEKVNGKLVYPDLTEKGAALLKKHNIRVADERLVVDSNGVAQPHYHFEAVSVNKAGKVNKIGGESSFLMSASPGQGSQSNIYFYGGAKGEFTQNDFNTRQSYLDSLGQTFSLGEGLTDSTTTVPFNYSTDVSEDKRNIFSNVLSDFNSSIKKQEEKTDTDPSSQYYTAPPTNFQTQSTGTGDGTDDDTDINNNITVNGLSISKEQWKKDKEAQEKAHTNNQHKKQNETGSIEVQGDNGEFVNENENATPFVLQSVKNSKNPKYVEALKKRGFTVEEYLKDPQGVLDKISKAISLEKDVSTGKGLQLFLKDPEFFGTEEEITAEEKDKEKITKIKEEEVDAYIEEEEDDDLDPFEEKKEYPVDVVKERPKGVSRYTPISNIDNVEMDLGQQGQGYNQGVGQAVVTVLTEEEFDAIESSKKDLLEYQLLESKDVDQDNLLSKYDHEQAFKTVQEYDKKSTTSALAHLSSVYNTTFYEKENWDKFAKDNNIDGEKAFAEATPVDTEEVKLARELLAENDIIFEELFSLSKYSGSHLNKVVALFGGHETEHLDFGILEQKMKGASLMFMTREERARLSNPTAVDLPKDRKNEIIYKSKFFVLNNYVKDVEDKACDLENEAYLIEDDYNALLKDTETYESDLAKFDLLKKSFAKNAQYRRNPDNTERLVGFNDKELAESLQSEMEVLVKSIESQKQDLTTRNEEIKTRENFLINRQEKLKNEYEAVFNVLNFKQTENGGQFGYNFKTLEGQFKEWEDGLKEIPVIGQAANVYLAYKNARLQLKASYKSFKGLGRFALRNNVLVASAFQILDRLEKEEHGNGYSAKSWLTDWALEIIAPSEGFIPTDKEATVFKNLPNVEKMTTIKGAKDQLGTFFSRENLRANNPVDFAYNAATSIFEALPYVQELSRARINSKAIARYKRIGKGDMRYNVNKQGMNWASRLSYKVKGSEGLARRLAQVKRNQGLLFFENMADGRARGLDADKAFFYAHATTLATGIGQAIVPDYRWFAGSGKKVQDSLISGLKKIKAGDLKGLAAWQKTLPRAFKSMIPDMIGEFGEEFIDMGLNDLVKGSFLANYSPEIQDVNAVGQMMASTFFLTGGLGVQKGRRSMRAQKEMVYSYYYDKSAKVIKEIDNQLESVDSAMANIKDKRTRKGRELKAILSSEKARLTETRNQATLIANAQARLSKYSTVQEVDIVIKKQKLQKQLQGLDPSSVGASKINEKIKVLNEQLKQSGTIKTGADLMNKSVNNMIKLFGVSDQDIKNGNIFVLDNEAYEDASERRNIEIKKINDQIDARIKTIEKQIEELTDAEKGVKHKDKKNKAKIKKLQKDRRTLREDKKHVVDGSVQPGFFYGVKDKDGKTRMYFVINKKAAMRSGNFFVAGHESFHALLFQAGQTVMGKKVIRAMGYSLLNKLNEIYAKAPSNNYVAQKFKKGISEGAYINEKTGELDWEEVLTIFSEALAQGDVELNDSFFGKVASLFRRMARETGLNWKIKDDADVINFIKDFNNEFLRGRFSRGFNEIRQKGLINIDPEFVRQRSQQAKTVEEAGMKEIGVEKTGAKVDEKPVEEEGKASVEFDPELNIVEDVEVEDFTEDEQFVRNLALGYTEESWANEGAENAATIIQQMGIFDRLIAAKLKVARSPEETKDFVKRVYSALYSDILGFNLENDDFFAYLNSRVRFRAGDVYNEEQKGKVEDKASGDISDMKGVGEIIDDSDPDYDNVQDQELDKKVHVGNKLGITAEIKKVIKRGFDLIRQGPAKTKEKEAARLKELGELGFVDGNGKIIDLNVSYKDMPNILYKVIAKRFGVDAEKLSPYIKKPFSKNLRREGQRGSNELLNAQMELRKIGMETLAAILPEGHTSTYEATGIAGTKYKVFYNKGKRVRNNYIWHKKPVTDINMLENMLGIIDGKSFREDRLAQQSVISMLNILGTVATIQTIVEVSKQTGDLDNLARANMEDGKSKMAQSIFFIQNPTKQKTIREGLPQVAIEMEDIEDRYVGKELVSKVKEIFKRVYKDSLIVENENGKKVNGVIVMADQLFGATGFLTQYALIKKNYEIMGMSVPRTLDKFIQDNLQSKELNDIDIFAAFGMTGPKGETLTKDAAFTKKGIINGRKNLVEKIKAIDKLVEEGKLTEKEGYEWLFMMQAMYSGAGVLGDNTYMPKSDGSYRLVRSTKPRGDNEIPGFITKQYAQVAFSQSDYAALVNRANTRFKIGRIAFNNKIKKKFKIQKNFEEKSKVVIKEIQEGNFDFGARKEQAIKARRLITFTVKLATERYNNEEDLYDAMDVVQELFMFGSSMESPSRKGAYVYGMAEGLMVNGKYTGDISKAGKDLEYDHLVPHHQLMLRIASIVQTGNVENVEKGLENIFEEFVVNIIPKTMDKAVSDMGMQYLMQENYEEGSKLGSLKGAFGRMYGEKTLGDARLKTIISLDGKSTVHGREYVRLQKPTSGAIAAKKSISYTRAIRKNNEMASNKEVKGISIWDFDDTLAKTNSQVLFTTPDGTTGKLTAEEFASKGAQLLEQGYVYDFSEFDKVIDGTPGPFLPKFINRIKKFGIKDNFILTARPVNSAASIQLFLKELGIEIPIENITGLANSTPEAKALWIVDKVGEGYNDIYFADDALQNVQAVKNVLDQFDVKSKVRQAKGKQSIDFSRQFNQMIERKSGIEAEKRFSKTKGEKRGFNKGRFKLWIAPSAEDFAGLLYNFIGKGKQGEADYKFFEDVLLRPFARAHNKINTARQQASNEYKELLKASGLRKRLREFAVKEDFLVEDAVRVYLWNKAGYEVPGMSEADLKELTEYVENDAELKAFADSVGLISRTSEGYVEPTNDWITQGISYDINQKGNEVRRKDYLTEFVENRKAVFGDWNERGELVGENMNKIEAAFGKSVREALQDILWRMENGTNRNIGKNKMVNNFMNYINGSIGATMFFNARSAVLQTISAVNFINWEDNNIFNAAAAFANQEQYWKDFSDLFNSDMLKQRRSGMQQDLNAAELMQNVSRTKGYSGKANAAIRFILQKGFLPTQMADSFAIAFGGATFYRNRINKYLSEGMSESEAKKKAMIDFQEIAEKTQQSARPDLISAEQASVLGRLVLAFQNTPMQYARIQKKAFRDLINGRGDAKSHVSKILYYGFAQNVLFYALQSALFALPFLDDDEEEEFLKGKKERMLNNMLDGSLRGIGVYGAIVSTIKNMVLRFNKEAEKGGRADYEYVVLEFANFSPPVGIKLRKMYNALQTYKFNRDEIEDGQWMLSAEAISGVVEAGTNVPLNRTINKINNLSESLNSQNAIWQRIAMALGWNRWDVGLNRKQKSQTSARGRRIIDRSKKSYRRKVERKVINRDKPKRRVIQR